MKLAAMKLVDQLRDAESEAEAPNAELLKSAADQIEWYCIILQEIADRNRCTCNPTDIEQGRSAPDCRALLAGDDAREAIGLDLLCKGRLVRRKPFERYN